MQKNCEQGESTMTSSFQAGTAVHTSNGLMAIEEIRVGTQVLTQGAPGEAACYRPVTRTVAQLDQPVYVVQIRSEAAKASTLFVTPDTAFQVEDASTRVPRPVAAKALQAGHTLFLAGGAKAQVQAAAQLFHTQHAQYACAADASAGIDILVDLSERQLRLADASVAQTLGRLEPREPVRVPVYHFEVEGVHSCYVGDVGVGVLNSSSTRMNTPERQPCCFSGDTFVSSWGGTEVWDGTWKSEIENMDVGDMVLSRDDVTGETAYKRVSKVSCNGYKPVFGIICEHSKAFKRLYGTAMLICVTAEHPFWVKEKGWVKVRDLEKGDELVTYDDDKLTFIEARALCRSEVYNIEVEDFHTYFVGFEGAFVHE
jgi:hypothetical protein